jgi:hypothetical protein
MRWKTASLMVSMLNVWAFADMAIAHQIKPINLFIAGAKIRIIIV